MDITAREVALAVVFAVIGITTTMRPFLMFLAGLNPLYGLILYYAILYVCLVALSKFELVIFGIKIKNLAQTLGVLLITFAFFMVISWTSGYVQYVTTGSFVGASPVFLQSEDGAVFWIWQMLLPAADVEVWRLLTYAVTPFLLTLTGGVLASKKVKFR